MHGCKTKSHEESFSKEFVLGNNSVMKIINNNSEKFKSPIINLHKLKSLLTEDYFFLIIDNAKKVTLSLIFK